jgi:hypothetical protein
MPILLEVLDGERKGEIFRAEPGQTIGRNRATHIINDPNISGIHAKFELDNKGQLILLDLESANGLLLNKKKVKKVALLPGVKLQLGRCIFLVREVSFDDANRLAPALGWQELLRAYVNSQTLRSPDGSNAPGYFDPVLELEFARGIQYLEILSVGFGPRLIGSNCWDIELSDSDAPDSAFELVPDKGAVRLNNLCGDGLTLNGQIVDSQVLTADDILRVGNSVMKVRFK